MPLRQALKVCTHPFSSPLPPLSRYVLLHSPLPQLEPHGTFHGRTPLRLSSSSVYISIPCPPSASPPLHNHGRIDGTGRVPLLLMPSNLPSQHSPSTSMRIGGTRRSIHNLNVWVEVDSPLAVDADPLERIREPVARQWPQCWCRGRDDGKVDLDRRRDIPERVVHVGARTVIVQPDDVVESDSRNDCYSR